MDTLLIIVACLIWFVTAGLVIWIIGECRKLGGSNDRIGHREEK